MATNLFFKFFEKKLKKKYYGSVWLEKWKSGRMEKCNDRKYLVFPRVCLVGRMEKWEGRKLFYLVEKKSEMIENIVYIN